MREEKYEFDMNSNSVRFLNWIGKEPEYSHNKYFCSKFFHKKYLKEKLCLLFLMFISLDFFLNDLALFYIHKIQLLFQLLHKLKGLSDHK